MYCAPRHRLAVKQLLAELSGGHARTRVSAGGRHFITYPFFIFSLRPFFTGGGLQRCGPVRPCPCHIPQNIRFRAFFMASASSLTSASAAPVTLADTPDSSVVITR